MSGVALSRRLVLEEPQRIPDGAGGFTQIWVALGIVWAEIRAGAGRERGASDVVTISSVPYRITVRGAPHGSPSRPRPEQRFRDGDRIFRIIAVAERDPKGRYLECYAREEAVA